MLKKDLKWLKKKREQLRTEYNVEKEPEVKESLKKELLKVNRIIRRNEQWNQ